MKLSVMSFKRVRNIFKLITPSSSWQNKKQAKLSLFWTLTVFPRKTFNILQSDSSFLYTIFMKKLILSFLFLSLNCQLAFSETSLLLESLSSKPQVAAHRGGGRSKYKSTIKQFQSAYEDGAEIIETDLRVTKDGTVVVYHDKVLWLRTWCLGRIETKTIDQVNRCRFRGHSEPIPTFRELLDWAKDKDVIINAEFKTLEVVIPALEVAKDMNALSSTYFQTRVYKDRYLSAREFAPTANLLVGAKTEVEVDAALALNDPFIVGIELSENLLTENIIERIHQEGKLASHNSFKFDRKKEKHGAFCTELFDMKLDIVVTDRVSGCVAQRDEVHNSK